MAKTIKSQNFYDTVNELVSIAKQRGVVHLYTDGTELNGRKIQLEGSKNELVNFGSCSYLGLETDRRLIDSGIEHLKRYGSQFSSSRTYVSIKAYKELEELLFQIFKKPLLISPSSTIGHLAVIPAIIQEHDAIIMDHQAHISMHHGTKLIDKNVTITVLRHSRLDELEKKIEELKNTHNRIWYFMDGIYSMYGDVAPAKKVVELLDKHPQLHLYVDDAHGMSWTGENGAGYFLSQIGDIHPKMIMSTSLAKSFGSAGGVFIFPNEEWCWRVKTWGGPLTYSGPQQPATIGCSIASAKIHLSDEIREKQTQLLDKIKFCNGLFQSLDLPLISKDEVPIKYVGLGMPKVGYNMVRRLMDAGHYVNLGIYPAVPENCTGVRFTITNHLTFEDIEKLAYSIKDHLPKALSEEGRTYDDITKPFKLLKKANIAKEVVEEKALWKVKKFESINQIDQQTWDDLFAFDSICSHQCLQIMEESFQGNLERENNWKFYYYLLTDEHDKIVCATFFTFCLIKNDMLLDKNVSIEVEKRRKEDPYFQTSTCFTMGSMLTEGKHLWCDYTHPMIKEAMIRLFDEVKKDADDLEAEVVFMRDFDEDDVFVRELFNDIGFIKTKMPNSNVLNIEGWNTKEEFLDHLPQKKRNRIKKEILINENKFFVKVGGQIPKEKTEQFYDLYRDVNKNNLGLNTFILPKKLFHNVNSSELSDTIELWLKEDKENGVDAERLVAVGCSIVKNDCYFPWVLGLDYNFRAFGVYRQLLYNAVLRAKALHCKKIYFGLTADEEKGKLNCESISRVSYIQVRDTLKFQELSLIEQLAFKNK
jgi:7-keto-8-aminopelargonate synthetase-like enzyme/predicted N-acyltransferase